MFKLIVSAAFLSVLLINAGSKAVAQAQESDCLRLGSSIIDLATGEIAQTVSSPYTREFSSPAGDHILTLTSVQGPNTDYRLLTLKQHERDEAVEIARNVEDVSWSPDGSRFAYRWWGESRRPHYVSVTSADGSETHTTRIPGEVPINSMRFRGFSADGQYVAYIASQEEGAVVGFLSIPDLRLTTRAVAPTFALGIEWSPTGHVLGYMGYSERTGSWVSIASPDDSPNVEYPIPTRPQFRAFTWSPDGQYVAVQQYQAGDDVTDIVVSDGTVLQEVTRHPHYGRESSLDPIFFPVIWSDDSRAALLWQQIGGYSEPYTLVRYHAAERRYEPVLENVYRLHHYSPDLRHLIVPLWTDAAQSRLEVRLYEMDTMTFTTLQTIEAASDPRSRIETASDLRSRVFWSPDSSAFVLVTTVRENEQYSAAMQWSGLDSIQPEFSAQYNFVLQQPIWLNDSEAFVVRARRDEYQQIDWVNVRTGERRTLIEGMTHIDLLQYDEAAGGFLFRWRNPSGEAGYDVFAPDGERLRRWTLAGEPTSVAEGEFPPTIFRSPDGQSAFISLGARGEAFQFFAANGETRVLPENGPLWLQTAAWSPDGTWFAYASFDEQQRSTVHVVDAEGHEIERFDQFPNLLMTGSLMWVNCDSGVVPG